MIAPNVSPPPLSRPASVVSNRSNGAQPTYSDLEIHSTDGSRDDPSMNSRPSSVPPNGVVVPIPIKAKENGGPVGKLSAVAAGVFPIPNQDSALSTFEDSVLEKPPTPVREEIKTELSISTSVNGTSENSVEPVAGPSTASTPTFTSSPATSTSLPRKSSSFRHVPLRSSAARSPMPSSPLRPPGTHSRAASTSSTSASRQFEQPISTSYRPAHPPTQTQPRSRITSLASVQSSDDRPLPTIPSYSQPAYTERAASVPEPSPSHLPQPSSDVIVPPPRTHSLNAGGPKPPPKLSQSQSQQSQSSSHTSTLATSSPAPSLPHLPLNHTAVPTRAPAPYRPGFQPKGVYRPLTEEFASLRKTYRDVGRIERTKLERRLEKLIQLHFSSEAEKGAQLQQKLRPAAATVENRRASSFFDLDLSDLRNMDAGELWRGVLQSQAVQGGKADIRGGCN
jgi:rabenosyn-5